MYRKHPLLPRSPQPAVGVSLIDRSLPREAPSPVGESGTRCLGMHTRARLVLHTQEGPRGRAHLNGVLQGGSKSTS